MKTWFLRRLSRTNHCFRLRLALPGLRKLRLLHETTFCSWRLTLVLACLGLATTPALAQVNVLPQGDFKNPIATAEWAKLGDLTATPHSTSDPSAPPADAVLPAGTSLNWDTANIATVNAKRALVSLDGIWRFIPATEGAPEPAKLGWGYIK